MTVDGETESIGSVVNGCCLIDETPQWPIRRRGVPRFSTWCPFGCRVVFQPGEALVSHPVELDVDFERVFGHRHEAYERLIGDAIEGNSIRFARQDAVETAWKIVQPLLDHPGSVYPYPRGSWGPPEADRVVAQHRRWHNPGAIDHDAMDGL